MINVVRKGLRQTLFVCAAIIDGELMTEIIPSGSHSDATQKFKDKFSSEAQSVLGPFYKKRARIIENTRTLSLTNHTKKAVYNDWIVNAFFLKEPVDQAYLVFIKRVDGKKLPIPRGIITVPISDLRFD